MSAKPEVHFWASGMRREVAQNYLLDLCGSDSQNFTEYEAEVTCERCLAALRLGTIPPLSSQSAPAGAPGPIPEEPQVIEYVGSPVAEQVRAAVLKEREEIIQLVKTVMVLAYPNYVDTRHRDPFRKVVEEIRKRE